jgi:uncharacterized protein (TIGR00251 family)
MPEWIKSKEGGILISIRVQPGASRDSITGIREGSLAIKLCSPPVDGRANDALIKFISRKVGVPPSSIQIIQGIKNRKKVLSVPGVSADEIENALSPLP